MNLSEKKCIPCHEGAPLLDEKKSKELLKKLKNDWEINQSGHLFREYFFNDFAKPMEFANQIAEIANQEDHHPDLKISWGKCIVEIWTHKINGLSESDFYFAAKQVCPRLSGVL